MAQPEINRIAEYYYASLVAGDEALTAEGAAAEEDFVRSITRQLDEAASRTTCLPTRRPKTAYGLTNRQVAKPDAELEWWLQNIRRALARGDISIVDEMLTVLLDRFQSKLDPNRPASRKLGMAVLKADVRAHESLQRWRRDAAAGTA